jgi:HAE1 family hydrophobic/amphiphilic exporter-1
MRSLYDLAIRRPVATAMFYLIVVTVGVVGYTRLPVDLLPPIEFPRLAVYVNYPNVGPQEMESIITEPLENALSSVPNLERMTSRSEEGRSIVSLEFGRDADLSEAANDVRAALDRFRDNIPPEAEQPGIWKFDPNSQEIVDISATSSMSLEQLTRTLEREIAQRFEQIPGVGSISVGGGVYREIQVQLRRDRLAAAALTPADVRDAIAGENVQLPGGNVKDGLRNLYVRSVGEYGSVDEIRNTVITVRNGAPIRVRDVADVIDGYEDVGDISRLDGAPVLRMEIQKQSGANTVSVAADIREEVDRVNRDRDDLELTVVSDQSTFIRDSMDSVKSAAIWGGILAVLVLYLFLRNGSTTFIISLSIPISIIATFGLLYFTGLTLNQMTFGGLALGIGLIVDNAIVVLENVVRHREREGRPIADAAHVGTREVAGAIVASTLTSSVIFLPVVFMGTTSGQLFQTLALVVVFALGCSLLVALTLVPMLASRFLSVPPEEERTRAPSRFQRALTRVEGWYQGRLDRALDHRRAIFGLTAAGVVGAVLLWPMVPVELTPEMETNEIDVNIRLDRGLNITAAAPYLEELQALVQPLLPPGDVASIATEVEDNGSAEMEIRLVPAEEREVDPTELADRIRETVAGEIPGARVDVRAQSGLWILRRLFSSGGGDQDVEIQLRGYDLEQARRLTRVIRARLEAVSGVVEARISEPEGRPEENIRFDRDRIYALGLSVSDVGRAVQMSVGGSRAGYFREGGDQFPVTVRLRPEDRLTSQDLEDIAVRTPDGRMVPVSTLVRREAGRSPGQIRHVNGQRVHYVTANLASGVALGDGVERIREELSQLRLPEGFSIVYGGAYEEQQQARRDFILAILMALALVYMVMAGQFERFLDPLVVMFSVPVALVGVVPTLLLTGTSVNIQSIMGMVMLVGIVVNNAIVLVDYLNLLRREQGLGVREAALEAARLRLRPILMTTITTILGLAPLALGWGAGASMQASLARVVIGGLLASTLITLVLIPALYISATAAAESAKAFARDQLRRVRGRPGVEPAGS